MFSRYQEVDSSFALKLDLSNSDPRWIGHDIVNGLNRKADKLAPRFSEECGDSSCTNSRPGADQPRRQQVWDLHAEALGWNLIADDAAASALALDYMRQGIRFLVGLETRQVGDRADWFQQAWVLKVGADEFTYAQEREWEANNVVQGQVAYALPGADAPTTVEVPLTKFQADWLEDVAMSGSESYAAAEEAGVRIVGHDKPRLVIPPAAVHHIGVAIGVRSDLASESDTDMPIGERRSILALARKVAEATQDRTALPLEINDIASPALPPVGEPQVTIEYVDRPLLGDGYEWEVSLGAEHRGGICHSYEDAERMAASALAKLQPVPVVAPPATPTVSVTTLAREDTPNRTGAGRWMDLIHAANRIAPGTFGTPDFHGIVDNGDYVEVHANAEVRFPQGDEVEIVIVVATTDLGAALIRQAAINLGLALDLNVEVAHAVYAVYADHVILDGVRYDRCNRAVGIARCQGHVLPGQQDCGWHK